MFVDAITAYLYAYDNGLAFPKDWKITNNFTWNEVFTNETSKDGYPILEVFQNAVELSIQLQKIRAKIGKPIIVHCWVRQIPHNKRAGSTAKRSPHINGRAVDFHIEGMTDKEVRNRILSIGMPVRIEDNTSGWVHIDTGNPYINDFKWGLFKA